MDMRFRTRNVRSLYGADLLKAVARELTGGACSMHGRGKMHTLFWLENLKGRDTLEDLGVSGMTILEWILGK
jgi:hypothetical protein